MQIEEELYQAEKLGISLISTTHPCYPKSLLQLKDPPLLYVLGEIPSLSSSIGIVGTRTCSIYGKEMAEKCAKECAAAGCTIISGLARGIDTAAHIGALHTGKTIAVIGSGLAAIYPQENKALAQEIADKGGAVISTYPLHTAPQKHHFPARNRILAALSLGMLLVEAPLKSGAMITMDLAYKMGKICAALPGRVDMESFKGNHLLLKTKKAELVENGADLLSLVLGVSAPENPKQLSLFELDEEEKNLLLKMGKQEKSLEEIAQCAQMPVAKVSALLMGLVLKQMVREFPGKLYKGL